MTCVVLVTDSGKKELPACKRIQDGIHGIISPFPEFSREEAYRRMP
jgi:hypothetical protein